METHNAVYHKKCYNKIGQKEYNRILARVGKKPCSEANSSSSTVNPHKRIKTELGTELCIFCEERETQQKICVLQESLTLVVVRIIGMSRNWNLGARWLQQLVIWMYMQSYVSIREKTGKDTEKLLNPRTLYDMMEGYPKQFGSNWRTWRMNLMSLLWKNHLCPMSYFTQPTNEWK